MFISEIKCKYYSYSWTRVYEMLVSEISLQLNFDNRRQFLFFISKILILNIPYKARKWELWRHL